MAPIEIHGLCPNDPHHVIYGREIQQRYAEFVRSTNKELAKLCTLLSPEKIETIPRIIPEISVSVRYDNHSHNTVYTNTPLEGNAVELNTIFNPYGQSIMGTIIHHTLSNLEQWESYLECALVDRQIPGDNTSTPVENMPQVQIDAIPIHRNDRFVQGNSIMRTHFNMKRDIQMHLEQQNRLVRERIDGHRQMGNQFVPLTNQMGNPVPLPNQMGNPMPHPNPNQMGNFSPFGNNSYRANTNTWSNIPFGNPYSNQRNNPPPSFQPRPASHGNNPVLTSRQTLVTATGNRNFITLSNNCLHCQEPLGENGVIITPCSHIVMRQCIENNRCPSCNQHIQRCITLNYIEGVSLQNENSPSSAPEENTPAQQDTQEQQDSPQDEITINTDSSISES